MVISLLLVNRTTGRRGRTSWTATHLVGGWKLEVGDWRLEVAKRPVGEDLALGQRPTCWLSVGMSGGARIKHVGQVR